MGCGHLSGVQNSAKNASCFTAVCSLRSATPPFCYMLYAPAHPPSIRYLLSLTLSIVARALAPAVKGNTSYGMAFSLTACSPPEKSIFSVTARELLYRKLSLTVSAGKKSSFSLPTPLTAFALFRCSDDGTLTSLHFLPHAVSSAYSVSSSNSAVFA